MAMDEGYAKASRLMMYIYSDALLLGFALFLAPGSMGPKRLWGGEHVMIVKLQCDEMAE